MDFEQLQNRILKKVVDECIVKSVVEVKEYMTKRQKDLLDKHVQNVSPIKAPGEKGGNKTYWMTKLEPKNRNNCKPIYGKTKEELEAKIVAYYLGIERDEKTTVREVLVKALGGADVENPKTTLTTGRRSLLRFDKRLNSTIGSIPIKSLNEGHIRHALDYIVRNEKLTAKEFNQTLTSLNKLADYCAYEHIDVCDIKHYVAVWRTMNTSGRHVFRTPTPKSSAQAFSQREAECIIHYALDNPSYKALAVALLIVTGLRIGELLALTKDDVFLDEGYIWIEKKENVKTFALEYYTKSNTDRAVYLSPLAEEVTRAVLHFREQDSSSSPFLFLNGCSNDGKLHARALDNFLREDIHRDVLNLGKDREARSAHDCRRTYASLEYLNGTKIDIIQGQLGHSSVSQTWDYIRDVVDATERKKQLKGIGVNLQKPRKIAVYADYTQNVAKEKAL